MSDTESECRSPKAKGVFSTLMADGDWLLLKGEYEKAVERFSTEEFMNAKQTLKHPLNRKCDENVLPALGVWGIFFGPQALTLKPEDKYCYVGRSKCYLKMGQYEKALGDAEASLQEDHSFFEGLYQKAEALYCLGEFEFALVFYHQGLKLRPQVHEFKLGIQKAQEAIENAVTVPAAIKQKLKAELQQKDTEMAKAKKPPTSKSEKKSKKYLGEFYEDRRYLENLLKDEDLGKGKTRNGEQLHDVIQGCLTYLDGCADFWNQQKPLRHPPKDPQRQRSKWGKMPIRSSSKPANFTVKSM